VRATSTIGGTAVIAGMLLAGSACGGASDAVPGSEPDGAASLEVTLQSDDSTSTVGPVCVEDIPEDLASCAAAPQNLGKVELDQTRKVTVQLPASVSEGGYRLRVNGAPLAGMEGVLNDKAQPFQIPEAAVDAPGETVVTVEALMTTSHPIAVWQFLLSDPVGPPA
jgi:hypothetical protein